jgi:hypothetical protein
MVSSIFHVCSIVTSLRQILQIDILVRRCRRKNIQRKDFGIMNKFSLS